MVRIKRSVSLRSGVGGILDALGTYDPVLAAFRLYLDSSFVVA